MPASNILNEPKQGELLRSQGWSRAVMCLHVIQHREEEGTGPHCTNGQTESQGL